jgi:hypothetical protein
MARLGDERGRQPFHGVRDNGRIHDRVGCDIDPAAVLEERGAAIAAKAPLGQAPNFGPIRGAMPRGPPKSLTAVCLAPELLAETQRYTSNLTQGLEEVLRMWLKRKRRWPTTSQAKPQPEREEAV